MGELRPGEVPDPAMADLLPKERPPAPLGPGRHAMRRVQSQARREAERERRASTRGGANRKPRKPRRTRAGDVQGEKPPLDEVLAGGPWEADGGDA